MLQIILKQAYTHRAALLLVTVHCNGCAVKQGSHAMDVL